MASTRRQLLVAASPHDDIGDTHWYRPDFDHNLVREAERAGRARTWMKPISAGVDLEEDRRATSTAPGAGSRPHRRVVCRRRERPSRIPPAGARPRRPPLTLAAADSRALHALRGVGRWEIPSDPTVRRSRRTLRRCTTCFRADGSGSCASQRDHERGRRTDRSCCRGGLGAADGAPAWDRLLATLPRSASNSRRLARSPVDPRAADRVSHPAGVRRELGAAAVSSRSHRPAAVHGLPADAAGHRAAARAHRAHVARAPERDAALGRYERVTLDELDATEQLVAALYANMGDVPLFKRLTLLYFAAASYAETARRLGRPDLAPGFLLSAHPTLWPGVARRARRRPPPRRAGPRERRSLPGSIGPSRRSTSPACATRSPGLVSGAGRGSVRECVEASGDGRRGRGAARALRFRGQPRLDEQRNGADQEQRVERRVDDLGEPQQHLHKRHDEHDDDLRPRGPTVVFGSVTMKKMNS